MIEEPITRCTVQALSVCWSLMPLSEFVLSAFFAMATLVFFLVFLFTAIAVPVWIMTAVLDCAFLPWQRVSGETHETQRSKTHTPSSKAQG